MPKAKKSREEKEQWKRKKQQRKLLQEESAAFGRPEVITLMWLTENIPAKYLNPLIRWVNDDDFIWFSTDEFVLRAVEIARKHQPNYDWFNSHQILFIFRSLLMGVAEISVD